MAVKRPSARDQIRGSGAHGANGDNGFCDSREPLDYEP